MANSEKKGLSCHSDLYYNLVESQKMLLILTPTFTAKPTSTTDEVVFLFLCIEDRGPYLTYGRSDRSEI